MLQETLQLERLVDDPEIRRAAAKTLKGFCLTCLPHHFPADLSDFFDEMAGSLQSHDIKRLEVIGFRGCAKSIMASLALVLWAALEHPDLYPDTRSQASINAASVQHELRNNDLILKDYGRLRACADSAAANRRYWMTWETSVILSKTAGRRRLSGITVAEKVRAAGW
jgi:hypothetical protein